MGTHWARQQAKKNELDDVLARAVSWIKANKKASSLAAGAAVIVLAVGATAFHRAKASREAAWDRLDLARALAFSGRNDEALEQVKEIEAEDPNAPARGFALLFAGDLSYSSGTYDQAEPYYSRVEELGNPRPLVPFALSDLASSYEASGRFEDAIREARKFLSSYPDHFLAPQVHSCLARSLEALGRIEDAKTDYQKIALEYPNTSFAAWAQTRFDALNRATKNR